ncbi:MAG: P1 family peptidase [Myxococcota bacterium]
MRRLARLHAIVEHLRSRRAPVTVAAGAAVNAAGSIVDPATGAVVAGGAPLGGAIDAGWRGQTTLIAVVTDAPLDRDRCTVIARMASAGLARTIYPAFTPFDGDLVIAASTGAGEVVADAVVAGLGDAAARCVATAIVRAVARPGYRNSGSVG